jgi:hypothetical protein
LVANAYLEGTYSEVYPGVSQDVEGMKRASLLIGRLCAADRRLWLRRREQATASPTPRGSNRSWTIASGPEDGELQVDSR